MESLRRSLSILIPRAAPALTRAVPAPMPPLPAVQTHPLATCRWFLAAQWPSSAVRPVSPGPRRLQQDTQAADARHERPRVLCTVDWRMLVEWLLVDWSATDVRQKPGRANDEARTWKKHCRSEKSCWRDTFNYGESMFSIFLSDLFSKFGYK